MMMPLTGSEISLPWKHVQKIGPRALNILTTFLCRMGVTPFKLTTLR